MIIKNGIIECKCGNKFEWKTYFLEKNSVAVFKTDDVQANIIDKMIINNQYHITAKCPFCNQKHFVLLE